MHETSIVYQSTGGGAPVRRCQSRSVFGMAKYGEPPKVERSHGYVAGRIEFDTDDATLRLWPRTATAGTDRWRFIPDQEKAELKDDEGTAPERIALRTNASPRPPQAGRSDFIKIPSTPWPEELALKGFPMPDSMLLLPESKAVRFHRSREPLRDAIVHWALEKGPPVRLRLQAGEGGAGKTRLLIEVSDQLENTYGWRAGFLRSGESISAGLRTLLREQKPVLIVLDYAEARTQEIVELTKTALRTSDAPQVCLVLLARDGGDWWDHLADAAKDDQAAAAILRGVSSKTGPYRMDAEFIGESERKSAFTEALQDFAIYKKLEPPTAPHIALSADLFRDPLFIHLAALAYLRGQPASNDQELLGIALGHERSYWRRLLEESHLTNFLPAFEQAVALLTLCGSRVTAREAKALLRKAPRLRDVEPNEAAQVFDALRRLYAIQGGLVGLQPDLLGETLVSDALAKDDELLDVAFGEDSDHETVRHALTVLTRLARRVPAEERWLTEALSRNLAKISEDAMQVGIETGSPLPELHAKALNAAPLHERRRAVDALRNKLPKATSNLTHLNLEIRRQYVTFLDQKKSGSAKKRNVALVEAFSALSASLRDQGLVMQAADASLEAARLAEQVFRSADTEDRSRLASAYNDLGSDLTSVGRFEEAVQAAEKSEALWRALAEKQPKTYTPDWAMSLNNLAGRLSEVGRFEEGLQAAENSEALRRTLAKKQPDMYTANWAKSLNNLANIFNDVGRLEEGLLAAEKCEALWRALSEKQPDAHTGDWARSLHNLAGHLGDVGQFEGGLRAAEKSEALFRLLADKQPDSYTSDWAGALTNLGGRLDDVGRFEEGLQAAEKSEALWRVLAEKQPEAYMANWALSLGNLGSHLCDLGRFEEGLQVTEKSEALWRVLAEKQPGAYWADWAGSLHNLGVRLGEVGKLEEGLQAAEKSEALWRVLAEKQPNAYTADWAESLANLADSRLAAGDFHGAILLGKESISKIADSARDYPTIFDPWLAFAWRIIADAYLKSDCADEALAAATRSVEIWTAVARQRQSFEPKQVAKAFLTLIKSQLATAQTSEVKKTFERALDTLHLALSVKAKPLRPTLIEMLELIRSIDGDLADRAASGALKRALDI